MNMMLAGLVWCFSSLLGLHAAHTLRCRERMLFELLQFFKRLKLRMEYGAAPLLELLSDAQGEDTLPFPADCVRRVDAGETFCTAWKSAVYAATLPLTKPQMVYLSALGSLLGATDLSGQSQVLQEAIAFFSSAYTAAKQKKERSAPLYTCLGLFAGFSFFIFVI